MDFFYGDQAEFFSFYRIPKVLITDKRFRKLSCEAKLLYGLLIDRMSLSMKNQWLDRQNRVYIYYTIENIMEDLGCGHEKAGKLLVKMNDFSMDALTMLLGMDRYRGRIQVVPGATPCIAVKLAPKIHTLDQARRFVKDWSDIRNRGK